MNTTDAESAVRSYLLWLENPGAMKDEAAIDQVTQELEQATDPIEKLRLLSRLDALQVVDGDAYRTHFLAHAKIWADANEVSADAFRRLGVSAVDLRDAGFDVAVPRAKATSSTRRTRVSPEAVRAAVPSTDFTIAEIEAASGASTATVRKVITAMIDEGVVVDLGPALDHEGRGRAPMKYRKR